MFRISLMLLVLSISFSQWGVRGGVYLPSADGLPTFITVGAEYMVVDNKKMPINLTAQYGFGSQDVNFGFTSASATYGMFEIGANLHYPLQDMLDLVASAAFTSYSVSISGFTLGSPDSDFTIGAGIAYKLSDNLAVDGGYAFTGADGVRAGLKFSF